LSGLEPAVLPDDTFGVSWNREAVETEMQEIDRNIRQIQVNGIVLNKAQDADFQDSIGINLFTSRTKAVYVLPDAALLGPSDCDHILFLQITD